MANDIKLSKAQITVIQDLRKGELRYSSGTGYLIRLHNGMHLKTDYRTINALRNKGILDSMTLTTFGKTIKL